MAKKKRKPRRTSKVSKNYQVSGSELKHKNKFCPKCGPGVFLAQHKNRLTCGKCHYMEKI
jgi:small subunit ribosomal protein S27Ae